MLGRKSWGRVWPVGTGMTRGRWVTGPEEDRDRSASLRMQATVFVAVLGVDVVEGREP